jgi:Transposase DDE domain
MLRPYARVKPLHPRKKTCPSRFKFWRKWRKKGSLLKSGIIGVLEQPIRGQEESKLMKNRTLKLTDREVLSYSREHLKVHFPLQAQGYKCQTDDLLNALLGMAVHGDTLEAVCNDLAGLPHPATLRGYYNQQLRIEDLAWWEARVNAALAAQLPKRLWKHAQALAIDFHDEPYYGKSPQDTGLWVRGRPQEGTSRFYRLASAYVIVNGLRQTLAITFVLPEADHLHVLKHLLRRVLALNIRLKALFLDKGFAGVDEMRFLDKLGVRAVIACPIRGKSDGGTRRLCQGRKSYLAQHTFESGDHHRYPAKLAVCRAFTTSKRTQRSKAHGTWLVYILIHVDLPPQQVKPQYRLRFGVETSYRCLGQVRAWTTSQNPAYRFVLLGVGFFVVNVWIRLRWQYAQIPRRGGRIVDEKLLPLSRLARFMARALQKQYQSIEEITAHAPPLRV